MFFSYGSSTVFPTSLCRSISIWRLPHLSLLWFCFRIFRQPVTVKPPLEQSLWTAFGWGFFSTLLRSLSRSASIVHLPFFFVNSIKLVSFRQSVVRIVGIVELRFGATNFTQRLQVPSSASVIWLAHKAESSGYSEQHTEHHSEFRFCLIIRSFVSSFILTAVLLCLPNIRTNFPLYSDF